MQITQYSTATSFDCVSSNILDLSHFEKYFQKIHFVMLNFLIDFSFPTTTHQELQEEKQRVAFWKKKCEVC